MSEVTTIGLDLAKTVFQVHGYKPTVVTSRSSLSSHSTRRSEKPA